MKDKVNCCIGKLIKCEYCDKDNKCQHPNGKECAGHIGI